MGIKTFDNIASILRNDLETENPVKKWFEDFVSNATNKKTIKQYKIIDFFMSYKYNACEIQKNLVTLCNGTGLITQVPSLSNVLTRWSGCHLL